MSWTLPPSGQWNPGITMTPNINMGYTPDQWALLQQQNWQQWAQWQQQYAQWQAQYGEKYAEQTQTVQSIGAVPPLPPMSCVPPPAPPPPDQPPPPHQNDQPLYSHHKPPPPTVPVPSTAQAPSNPDNMNNTKTHAGNSQNWSFATETRNVSQNSEALKKLSEEERLFDIQFQKWEEEIEKWKKENANHPDKEAYSEYEQKFEACQAQLLERRQQMKQKRASLMSSASQTLGNTGTDKMPLPVPILQQNMNTNTYPTNNLQTSNFNINTIENYSNQIFSQYQEYNAGQPNYSSDNNYNQTNLQCTCDSYDKVDPYLPPRIENSNFLHSKETSKAIPGLDLVPEVEKKTGINKPQDIDVTEENIGMKQAILSAPDYSIISKGINNILGDEKIMNILTMVRQKASNAVGISQTPNNAHLVNEHQYTYNSAYGIRQNMAYNNQSSGESSRQDNDSFIQRQYDQGQKDIYTKEQSYGNYAPNNVQNMPLSTLMNPMQVGQSSQNQSMENSHDNYQGLKRRNGPDQLLHPVSTQPIRSKWIDQPLFTPSIIVEYEHKPLRLKARDFIEPVHTFDYNHKSKESDHRKKDFEREVDELFSRQPRTKEVNIENYGSERLYREPYYRDYERRPRDNVREDYRRRVPLREGYDERRKYDDKYDDRKRDDSDKYKRREDFYRDREKGRDRDEYRDRYKDYRRDENRYCSRSTSRDKENRKRDHSKENDGSGSYPIKKGKETTENEESSKAKHIVMIDDILEPPGREMRPEKIVIILRGLPGSGKSYLAKLIRDKEAEHGGTVRIMSIDDYFMQEGEIEINDAVTGKTVNKPSLKYEYDQELEESYFNSLKRAFKRTITDGYFTFLIFDAVNEHLKCYADVWNFARQNGFQVYVCTMEADVATCFKRNIHNRTQVDIECLNASFFITPKHHIQLDPTTLLQSAAIPEVQMEDADDGVTMEDAVDTEVENHFTSKWEKTDDAAQLARLDGTSKPLRPSQLSMIDYLQIDDWKPSVAKPGKKTVRWADIEERRQQEKMRAIGFVVGQTDWNRMTDPTMGSSALTQTKYIERVRRM